MNNTALQSIIQQIDSGAMDQHFAAIKEAITQRREVLEHRLRNELKVRQTVWFNEKARPTYLIGAECEIVEINRVRVQVRVKGGSIGRYSGVINCPVGLLQVTKP